MAENKKLSEETIVDVEQAYSSAEKWVDENQKTLINAGIAIILVVGAFVGFKYYYLPGQEQTAHQQMWKAESYFAKDSLNQALNGDGINLGFLDIIDDYGMTKAANLANYYVGLAYMQQGEYDLAIDYLAEYNGGDAMVAPVAKGAIGDCYMELEYTEDAVDFYLKAADMVDNKLTSPHYLMKAAAGYEALGDYSASKELYKRVQLNYPESRQANGIDKYLARAEAFIQ